MIIIFTYNRPKKLINLVNELQQHDEQIVAIDDGSDYPQTMIKGCDYIRAGHHGKEGFWKQWQGAFDICKLSKDTHFMFLQDDYRDYEIERMQWIDSVLETPYAFEFRNVGIKKRWTPQPQTDCKIKDFECHFTGSVDCVFSCNRKALEALNFNMEPVDPKRFDDPTISSGVGKQLSQRFYRNRIPMFKPKKSLCKHTGVESLMNPEERKRNPLTLL